jgi:TFIIF-interacting CTD phosphatase-like protein
MLNFSVSFNLANNYFLQDGVPRPLLPPLSAKHAGRKCLVLDLDETLVHSSFKVCRPFYLYLGILILNNT